MADFPSHTADIDYRFEGATNRPVVVFSHSLGATSAMWAPQIAALGDRFRLLLYDHRGHGQSGAPPRPWSLADFGRDVVGLLDRLGLERVHFCGISLGGMVGLWLAQNAADRLERLVVANTAAKIADPTLLRKRIELIEREGVGAIVENVLDRWFTENFRRAHPEAVENARGWILGTPAANYAATSAAICEMELREGLGAMATPTLVLCGKHDLATPPDWGRAIAGAIPGAALLELDAAHLSSLEASDAFNRAVQNFLTTNGRE